ncbi:hypothetical protein GF354_05260 [Candidatus Peregrinibacteria bacterium]|nr:hypothetical protein [Candidatus Peregrinibacteria bacterium]
MEKHKIYSEACGEPDIYKTLDLIGAGELEPENPDYRAVELWTARRGIRYMLDAFLEGEEPQEYVEKLIRNSELAYDAFLTLIHRAELDFLDWFHDLDLENPGSMSEIRHNTRLYSEINRNRNKRYEFKESAYFNYFVEIFRGDKERIDEYEGLVGIIYELVPKFSRFCCKLGLKAMDQYSKCLAIYVKREIEKTSVNKIVYSDQNALNKFEEFFEKMEDLVLSSGDAENFAELFSPVLSSYLASFVEPRESYMRYGGVDELILMVEQMRQFKLLIQDFSMLFTDQVLNRVNDGVELYVNSASNFLENVGFIEKAVERLDKILEEWQEGKKGQEELIEAQGLIRELRIRLIKSGWWPKDFNIEQYTEVFREVDEELYVELHEDNSFSFVNSNGEDMSKKL